MASSQTGGRALSVLPPHHIVVATADQLLTDLPTAYARFAELDAGRSSMMSIISGPSRTGDIERVLVLGAHGRKRVSIICSHPHRGNAARAAEVSPPQATQSPRDVRAFLT